MTPPIELIDALKKDYRTVTVGKEPEKGGQAVVYKFTRLVDNIAVAVKVFNADVKRERYENETECLQVLTPLHYQGIIQYLAHGQVAIENKPRFYLILSPWCKSTLRDFLRECRPNAREAIYLIHRIATIVDFCHDHSVFHRDVKPENILLDSQDHLKLTDFGLGRMDEMDISKTLSGTPFYMAPEQCDLEKNRYVISPRLDIYPLGAILYEILTGKKVLGPLEFIRWKSTNNSKKRERLNTKVQSGKAMIIKGTKGRDVCLKYKVAKDLHPFFEHALAPEPQNRFSDIESFLNALHDIYRERYLQNHATSLEWISHLEDLAATAAANTGPLKPDKTFVLTSCKRTLQDQRMHEHRSRLITLYYDNVERENAWDHAIAGYLERKTYLLSAKIDECERLQQKIRDDARCHQQQLQNLQRQAHELEQHRQQQLQQRQKLAEQEPKLIQEHKRLQLLKQQLQQKKRQLESTSTIQLSERQEPQKIPDLTAASQYPGFIYLRTETHSCGGQTNTVKEYRHDKTGMEFVLIPGGSFQMGSNESSDEKPVHRVTVSSFLMAKTEVTNKQYMQFVRSTGSNHPEWAESGSDYNIKTGSDDYYKKHGSRLTDDNSPVVGVSWNNAVAFCKWAGFRLPTEAEWEYACRSGTKTKYYWGNSMNSAYCWYDGNSNNTMHSVMQKDPNAFGLYDMSGNVWEWCQDWYDEKYYVSSPQHNPTGPSTGSSRVRRGGGWAARPLFVGPRVAVAFRPASATPTGVFVL